MPFRKSLRLLGFSNDELVVCPKLSAILTAPLFPSARHSEATPLLLSPHKVAGSFLCLGRPFHSASTGGPCFCSSTTLQWLACRQSCLHLQPLFCYPTALPVSTVLPLWCGLGLNCRPYCPPTVSQARTSHSSQIALPVLVLKLPQSLTLLMTGLPHYLPGKASLFFKPQLKGHHHFPEVFFDKLTMKDALCPFLLRTYWLILPY